MLCCSSDLPVTGVGSLLWSGSGYVCMRATEPPQASSLAALMLSACVLTQLKGQETFKSLPSLIESLDFF